jgi:hypothetical protein
MLCKEAGIDKKKACTLAKVSKYLRCKNLRMTSIASAVKCRIKSVTVIQNRSIFED